MDALKLLKKDHDEVKKMLKDLEATTDRAVKTRQDLFGRLRFSLTVHEQMEEAVLYPALKEHRPRRSPSRPTRSTTSSTRSSAGSSRPRSTTRRGTPS